MNVAIAENQPGQAVTLRACKARLRTLMDAHRNDEMASLRARVYYYKRSLSSFRKTNYMLSISYTTFANIYMTLAVSQSSSDVTFGAVFSTGNLTPTHPHRNAKNIEPYTLVTLRYTTMNGPFLACDTG